MLNPTAKVKKSTTGLHNLFQQLKGLRAMEVEWGFFEDAIYTSEKNNGIPVATIANMNEKGFSFEGQFTLVDVPARPFFSDHVANVKKTTTPVGSRVVKIMSMCVEDVIRGKAPFRALHPLGTTLQAELQTNIDDWTTPDNAESTVEIKGVNDPLVETGFMRDSVSYQLVKNKVTK